MIGRESVRVGKVEESPKKTISMKSTEPANEQQYEDLGYVSLNSLQKGTPDRFVFRQNCPRMLYEMQQTLQDLQKQTREPRFSFHYHFLVSFGSTHVQHTVLDKVERVEELIPVMEDGIQRHYSRKWFFPEISRFLFREVKSL